VPDSPAAWWDKVRRLHELAEAQLQTRPNEGLRLDLIAALESLPAHYLEIILLRDFEELSIAELAERLGLQIRGAKSRLHRARELVREYPPGTPPSPRMAESPSFARLFARV
jgi:RNA polymerase sigma factor (sigma-70 family)